ncbi:MAG: DNA-processing protein DprA [Sphaerochaetaceae bacterium]|jgi:DNA processing protein
MQDLYRLLAVELLDHLNSQQRYALYCTPLSISALFATYSKQKDLLLHRYESFVQHAQSGRCTYISIFDDGYPPYLKEAPWAPLVLMLKGEGDLNHLMMAIIGSNRATSNSMQAAFDLGLWCADNDIAVIAGFSKAIDQHAYRGSFSQGGKAFAVLGGGIEQIHAMEQKTVTSFLKKGGVFISAAFPFDPSLIHLYPKRNYLIAALCHEVVVIEASMYGAAYQTALWALELGKEVAVHQGGFPCSGNHQLVLDGAPIIEFSRLPVVY